MTRQISKLRIEVEHLKNENRFLVEEMTHFNQHKSKSPQKGNRSPRRYNPQQLQFLLNQQETLQQQMEECTLDSTTTINTTMTSTTQEYVSLHVRNRENASPRRLALSVEETVQVNLLAYLRSEKCKEMIQSTIKMMSGEGEEFLNQSNTENEKLNLQIAQITKLIIAGSYDETLKLLSNNQSNNNIINYYDNERQGRSPLARVKSAVDSINNMNQQQQKEAPKIVNRRLRASSEGSVPNFLNNNNNNNNSNNNNENADNSRKPISRVKSAVETIDNISRQSSTPTSPTTSPTRRQLKHENSHVQTVVATINTMNQLQEPQLQSRLSKKLSRENRETRDPSPKSATFAKSSVSPHSSSGALFHEKNYVSSRRQSSSKSPVRTGQNVVHAFSDISSNLSNAKKLAFANVISIEVPVNSERSYGEPGKREDLQSFSRATSVELDKNRIDSNKLSLPTGLGRDRAKSCDSGKTADMRETL